MKKTIAISIFMLSTYAADSPKETGINFGSIINYIEEVEAQHFQADFEKNEEKPANIKFQEVLEIDNFAYIVLGLVGYKWLAEKGFKHEIEFEAWDPKPPESEERTEELLKQKFSATAFEGYEEEIDAKAKEFGLSDEQSIVDYKSFFLRAFFTSNIFNYSNYIKYVITLSSDKEKITEILENKAQEEKNKDKKVKEDNCCCIVM